MNKYLNKYQYAYYVIETILHLMCGEEREDGFRPTQDELIEAMKDIKELVEKDLPAKPELISDGDYDGEPVYDMWKCPNCEKLYEIDYDVYNYCPNCGQHIDRSEIDD